MIPIEISILGPIISIVDIGNYTLSSNLIKPLKAAKDRWMRSIIMQAFMNFLNNSIAFNYIGIGF